jgi:hypothetical protein
VRLTDEVGSGCSLASMDDRTPESLWVVLTRKVGIRNAFKVLLFVAQWAHVYEYLRGPLRSIDEYAEFWRVSERFAYRQQKLFREALGDSNPNRLWQELRTMDPGFDDLTKLVDQIRKLDLGTPRRTPKSVEEMAARIGTLRPVL